MTYKETLNFLFEQLPMYQRIGGAAYRKDLNNTLRLSDLFNNPEKKFKSIHVGGTNGKGSVSHMLAAILQQAGYKVGLHTSPHLIDFRERIKIDGAMISEEDVVNFVERFSAKRIEDLKPSFFEFSVIMAFDYFASQKVDVAIVEVGMGGRLDSTNIITPELSIITNISLDHTAFLGSDIASIAEEKAGIIKKGIPIVIGETHQETESVFRAHAQEKNASIFFADQHFSLIENGNELIVENDNFRFNPILLDLKGDCQKKNVLTVLQAIEIIDGLGFDIRKESVSEALENVSALTGLQGRWQILKKDPLIVCDTAHNKAGVEQLVRQINRLSVNTKHLVWGMVDDKEITPILKLLPCDATYYFTKAQIPRSMNPENIKKIADTIGLHSLVVDNVKEAFESARQKADKNDLIFVGGSNFVVADFLNLCKINID